MFSNKYLHLLRLLQNERKPLTALRAIQNQKLKRLIHHAYQHVPFYRNRFKQINLHPDDIQTVDDLSKIPVIDKDDFHKSDQRDLIDLRIQNTNQLIPFHTSGSSGKTLGFFVDRRYNELRKAQFLRPYLTNGIGWFERSLWFRSRPSTKTMFHQKIGILRDYQAYSGSDPESQIQIVRKIKPAVMKGYGSTFQLMASALLEKKMTVPPPRLIFTDSELLSRESRFKIEQAFQTRIIDIYGTYETDNVAYECHCHEGYHMAVDCVIMEFLKDGQQVKPGEEGEIVFTVLDNFAFPFIRYNVHDLATYMDKPCSCGRTFPLMGMIGGRTYDYAIKQNGVKVSSTTLARHFWRLGPYIHEFQIIQEKMDLIRIDIVPTKFYCDEIRAKIERGFKEDLCGAVIHIQLVDHIPREASGKLQNFKTLIGS